MKTHKNYGVYKEIKQDLRYGLLELQDKIQVHKCDDVIFEYEADDEIIERDFTVMTVQEVLNFISKNQ
ncbi:MAG TPA: hypothetical protein VK982_04970 [Bacteroidales bacterium]|nr:hypothetical protein [Bacteroidales bacterium]